MHPTPILPLTYDSIHPAFPLSNGNWELKDIIQKQVLSSLSIAWKTANPFTQLKTTHHFPIQTLRLNLSIHILPSFNLLNIHHLNNQTLILPPYTIKLQLSGTINHSSPPVIIIKMVSKCFHITNGLGSIYLKLT